MFKFHLPDASIALARATLDTEVPRFVFASTNLVYGSGAHNSPSREEDELRPGFPYPQTKVTAEEALLRLHREKGLGLCIVLYGLVLSMVNMIPMSQNFCQ